MGINTKRANFTGTNKLLKTAHANFMGGLSFDISNPLSRLRSVAASCFFGEPKYYDDDPKCSYAYSNLLDILGGKPLFNAGNTSKAIEQCIDDALDFSIEGTLIVAAQLRNQDNIRTTPQVILVRAANHVKSKGTDLIRKYAPEIIKRGDEPSVCLAYQLQKFGKPVPNSLKKALGDYLTNANEYTLAKYKMKTREVSTVDVVNMVHPKSTDALTKLVNGQLSLEDKTWEAIKSAGGSWEDCIPVMGHMALLRNLRNFAENNVSTDLYLDKLKSSVSNGKQLPFRYYTAYEALKSVGKPIVLDAVEECLELSYDNVAPIPGKTISLCDNSGSAWGAITSEFGSVKVAEIANLTGVITGKKADEGYVGIFGDRLEVVPIRKKQSTFDFTTNLNRIGQGIGHATENGIWLFLDRAIRNKEHWDNIFIYSDMQAGHGGLYGNNPYDYRQYTWNGRYIHVPMLIKEYRKINPKVNVFLVQVAGYKDTLMPEFYDRTYIIGGWSAGILNFASTMINLRGN